MDPIHIKKCMQTSERSIQILHLNRMQKCIHCIGVYFCVFHGKKTNGINKYFLKVKYGTLTANRYIAREQQRFRPKQMHMSFTL